MNQYIGIYRFFVKDFNKNELIPFTARCVVIGETEKSYKIQLLTHIQRKAIGDVLWIQKKNLIQTIKIVLQILA